MANHGYVIRHNECSAESLNGIIEEFCADARWNDLIVRRDGDYWEVTHPKHSGYIGVSFGSFFTVIEDEDGEILEEKEEPAIELRHGGPRRDYMWWVDFSLQDFIADRLRGKTVDDGHGDILSPEPEKFPTLKSFKKMMRHPEL